MIQYCSSTQQKIRFMRDYSVVVVDLVPVGKTAAIEVGGGTMTGNGPQQTTLGEVLLYADDARIIFENL